MIVSQFRNKLNLLLKSNGVSPKDKAIADTPNLPQASGIEVEISPDDPLVAYFAAASGVVEIDKLQIESPALSSMRSAGIKLAVPLVSQGELIGLINLGPRRSDQEYSSDDRRMLNTLAIQSGPALRVAQLARLQQLEARELERFEQELRVARVIQQTLLPKELPIVRGYQFAAHWQPARAVSGDFYDFLSFPDGRLGVIVADVTDKGVPAALVMATTRTLLREAAERLVSPGKVLQRTNELLCPDIPRNMFVTCLYLLIEPTTGQVVLANAGHNLPIKCGSNGNVELRVRGMPLGLLPGMSYEEQEVVIESGESLLLYSDGLVEAHNPRGEMFESPRLLNLVKAHRSGKAQIEACLRELADFTGSGWEQEDDVTMVVVERVAGFENGSQEPPTIPGWRLLSEFEIESTPGNERKAVEKVLDAVRELDLGASILARLKTAVAECSMNAIEHGNQYQEELTVGIQVLVSDRSLSIRITDCGGEKEIPAHTSPNLESKLAGRDSTRGWGLFLIRNMVDEMNIYSDGNHHTFDLVLHLNEGQHESSIV